MQLGRIAASEDNLTGRKLLPPAENIVGEGGGKAIDKAAGDRPFRILCPPSR